MRLTFPKPSIEVPPEILARILACLEKKDLKEVRLVCRQLERSAVSLLFDEVYLSAHPAELKVAQSTVRNFGKSIKTVLFSAVDYPEIKWGLFKNTMRPSAKETKYVRLAYTNYCKLRQEQRETFQAGTYFSHLCYALRTVPNAHRLVITDFEASSAPLEWERRRSRQWRIGDCPTHCSIQGCSYGNLKHLSYMIRPRRLLRTATRETDTELEVADPETQNTDPWALVMMALAATGSHVREFELDALNGACVPRGGFDNSLQQPFALQGIFQHFQRLRLCFRIVPDFVEKHVAQTLSTATNLTSLCINAIWELDDMWGYRTGGPTSFQEIIGECEFPQLRSLILNGFDSTEAELVGFLRSSSYLQHLTLTYHILRGKDNWESCANRIKIVLPNLKHVMVNALIADSNGRHARLHRRCSCTDVLEFFFQGGANPFILPKTHREWVTVAFLTDFDDLPPWPRLRARNRVWSARGFLSH